MTPSNGLHAPFRVQNGRVILQDEVRPQTSTPERDGRATSTVLVAIESPEVREGLVAILSALECFHVIGDTDSCEEALALARLFRPRLALVDQELGGAGGCWTIREFQSEGLADVVVAIGRRADGAISRIAGAHAYVQIGTAPRELVSILQAAIAAA